MGLAMNQNEVLLDPSHQVVLESTLDDLVKDIRCNSLTDICVREVLCVREVQHEWLEGLGGRLSVTVPSVTLARKVGPGLQDLQTRARRILAERNAEKAEENTWISRMVAAENINEIKALIKSRDSA